VGTVRTIDLSTPSLFPLALDVESRQVNFLPLDRLQYEAAGFLDERLLETLGPGSWIPWRVVDAAEKGEAPACHFIFHLGHVGSTLLSRLLGAAEGIFALREPALLKTLTVLQPGAFERSPWTAADFEHVTSVVLQLLSRVFDATDRSLVKATSWTGELGAFLLTVAPDARAILLFARPRAYLASLLASPASRSEARTNAAWRRPRLARRLQDKVDLDAASDAEAIALAWAAGMTAMTDTAATTPERVLWVDFDELLSTPTRALGRCLSFLGERTPDRSAALLSDSHLFSRYSKDMRFRYSPEIRQLIIEQAQVQHAREIETGLAWLADLARRSHRFRAIIDS
jgi:hypothetical protein